MIAKIYEAMSALAEQPEVKPNRTVAYACPICAASMIEAANVRRIVSCGSSTR